MKISKPSAIIIVAILLGCLMGAVTTYGLTQGTKTVTPNINIDAEWVQNDTHLNLVLTGQWDTNLAIPLDIPIVDPPPPPPPPPPSTNSTFYNSTYSMASYTVYIEEGYTHAKNGTSGQIDYSSSNPLIVINNAIDRTSRRGGIVLLRGYLFLLPTNIQMKSHVILRGVGDKTILKMADGVNQGSIIECVEIVDWGIENLVLDGNKANNIGVMGIYVEWSSSISTVAKISNVDVLNCPSHGGRIKNYSLNSRLEIDGISVENSDSYGMYVKPSKNLRVVNSRFIDNYQTVLLMGALDSHFEQCVFQGTIRDSVTYGSGLWMASYSSGLVLNCESYQNQGVGFMVSKSDGVKLQGSKSHENFGGFCFGNEDTTSGGTYDCSAFKNEYYGFYTADKAGNINFSHGYAWENGYSGIALFSLRNTAIGNKCWNNNQNRHENYDSGINIGATTGPSSIYYYNVVSNNQCWDDQATKTQEYGVKEINTDYNIIMGNIVVGNRQPDGILKVGQNTVEMGNIV